MDNLIVMDKEWHLKHLDQIKKKAGARYTPELNVDLPISEIFDGISRTEKFYATIREKYGELFREFRYVTSKYEESELQKNYDQIKKEIEALLKFIESIKDFNTSPIPWDEIQKRTKVLEDNLWKFTDQLRSAKEQVNNIKEPPKSDCNYQPSLSEKFNSDIHHAYKTREIIRYFNELALGTKAKLSNHPFLLLTGSAGTGKTHLLCDVVEQRIKNETKTLPAVLVFGEYFSDGKDVWLQILKQLDILSLFTNKDKFLQKLDELGKNAKCRSLFIIDALNETHTSEFWKNNLDRLIEEIKKYHNIALIVSVRNGFEKEVLEKKPKEIFIHEEHNGFRFREWEAVNKFFRAFSLPLPEIPLLMPEFQNPLFLLLFCKAFEKRRNKKDKQIFRGHEGATYIFETYIDSISKPIEKSFKIESGPQKNIWDTIIEKIAEEMVTQNDERIAEEKLIDIIRNAHPEIDISKLIQSLESNMLIVKVPRYEKGERIDGFDIRFPFQKFSDHLIGRYIFKRYENEFGKPNKNLETAKKYFSKKRRLRKLLSKSWNRGIIEALSIQCPEQLKGIEFIEVTPYLQKNRYLSQIAEESFVESLIWRNPKAFSADSKNTLKIINKNIIRTKSGHNQLLNAFLSVAPIPNHSFNAERLHQHLSKFSMPKRDSWWSTFLHYQYGERGAVDRLIEWSWSDQDNSHISDESIFLTSIALTWFLTTPNRFVRDKATKGLVCLLQKRIHLLPKLLEKFKDINDPYVIERLFAVAYGSVLRNQDDTGNLKLLSEWIYKNIFKDNKPPVHILLRDYARGVIELALKRNVTLSIDENNVNPPYESQWPENIPTEEDLKKKYYPEDFFKDKTKDRGFLDIWVSVMSSGDFARYVIGTNSNMCKWTGQKIGEKIIDKEKLYEKFLRKLSEKQKKLWEETNPIIYEEGNEDKEIKSPNFHLNIMIAKERKSESQVKKAYYYFKKSLSLKQRHLFEKDIEPFLDHNQNILNPAKNFDLRIAQRWIFNRVVELGYNPKIHGEFDKYVNSHISDRREHKSERIGKKYQWIAYHAFIALVSDHFEFKGDSWNESIEEYKGPWTPHIRDIDPSFILQSDDQIKKSATFSQWKEKHGCYDAWEKGKSDINWIKTSDDLPNPKNIIQLIDDNKKEWLVLEGFVKWEEKTPPEHKKYDIPVREVWYMLKSYIVKRKDAKKFYRWATKKNFMGRWMPESHNFYETFLGEYPNSIAFEDLRGDYNLWTKSGRGNDDLQIPVVVTDDSYLNEFTLDCSHSGSVSVKLPCKWLVNNMELYHNFLDGRFYDKKENLITLATSVFEESFPSALLIDKKALINFLDKNGYAIFWTLLGEKQLIGGSFSGKDFIGRLEISGAYTLGNKEQIIGISTNKFNK
jgi:archaellum component FlaC